MASIREGRMSGAAASVGGSEEGSQGGDPNE